MVKLNIGGHKYLTSRDTLFDGWSGDGCAFFKALLDGRFEAKLVNGDYLFIDRKGRYFEPILDYLRTGVWQLPGHLRKDERLVLAEAQFYGVEIKLWSSSPTSPFIRPS